MEVFDLTKNDGVDDELKSTKKRSISNKNVGASKKSKKASSMFALLWIGTNGKGRSKSWSNKNLRVIGVYPTKGIMVIVDIIIVINYVVLIIII